MLKLIFSGLVHHPARTFLCVFMIGVALVLGMVIKGLASELLLTPSPIIGLREFLAVAVGFAAVINFLVIFLALSAHALAHTREIGRAESYRPAPD